MRLVEREFVVNVSQEQAWNFLAEVERWPSWAPHIRNAKLDPQGTLNRNSTGSFRLSNGLKSDFTVVEFHPPARWRWVGNFLWLSVSYDHRFESISEYETRLVWTVDAEGVSVSVLGRIFAAVYNLNLNRAIPILKSQIQLTSDSRL